MAAHYLDKNQTYYLEQNYLTSPTEVLSGVQLKLLERYLEQRPWYTEQEKQNMLQQFHTFEELLGKVFKANTDPYHREAATISKLVKLSSKPTKPWHLGGATSVDTLENEYEIYGIYSDYHLTPGAKYLKKIPIAKITDNVKSSKIRWGTHKTQAQLFTLAPLLIKELEKLTANDTYQETLNIFKQEGHPTQTKRNRARIDTLNISIIDLVASFRSFWASIEKDALPQLKKNQNFKEEDHIYQEFTGSLNKPEDFNSSKTNSYYLMAEHKGEEGFVGLHYGHEDTGGALFRFKIVKTLDNAHIFNRDMSEHLRAFKNLTKLHLKTEFTHTDTPKSKEAQKVAAYIDKMKIEKSLLPQQSNVNDSDTGKGEKIKSKSRVSKI